MGRYIHKSPDVIRKELGIPEADFRQCLAEYALGIFKLRKRDIKLKIVEGKRSKGRVVSLLLMTHKQTGTTYCAGTILNRNRLSKTELRKIVKSKVDQSMATLETNITNQLRMNVIRRGFWTQRRKRNEN